ncbi:kelch domain-containing protein 3, partial [Actinomortierella wolfii]
MRIAIALSASAVMLSAVVAQRPGPPAFLSMASAAAKDVIIFHGGQLNTQQTTYTSEMWALDVTVSWKSSSPAWTNLTAPGAPRVAEHSAVMSKDFSQLMVTNPSGDSSPFLYLYSLKSKTWSTAPAPAAEAAKWATRRDVYFVTDKDTGNAWMIGGVQGTQPTNSVDKFDPTTGQWTANMIPSSANKQLAPYSTGTAHYYNGKIYIFGGYDSTTGVRGYQSFQRLPYVDVSGDTPVVGDQYTLGPIPPPRQDHCSVLTGSDKVYIFGGYDANSKQTLEDMWVLDLPTWTWKQLIPGPGTRPRRQHACHIIGANIVIFGGAGANLTGYPSDVQVYDVVASAWAA